MAKQTIYFFEVAEAYAANVRTYTRNQKVELQLDFQHALAQRMLLNNLDSDGKSVTQVEQPHTHNAVETLTEEHILDKRTFL